MGMGSIVKEALGPPLILAKILCFVHVTNNYVFGFASTYGPSMLPTLDTTGHTILTERITKRLGKIGLGDVVTVRSPEAPTKVVVKRVVGVEGDEVSYLLNPGKSDERTNVVVPKGHVWVQGDNIYDSRDSRQFGPVPYALLESRVCVAWPQENLAKRFLPSKFDAK